MIKDDIAHLIRYSLNSYFAEFKRLIDKKVPFENFPEQIKVIPLEYKTKNREDLKFESHKKYIDVHHLLDGEELVLTEDIKNLNVITEYNSKDDYQLFEGKPSSSLHVRKGDFLILFPNEAHMTGCMVENPETVKKTVFKIPV